MARNWPMPEDSRTDRSAFVEHQTPIKRGQLSDVELAEKLDVGVNKAHEMIEDVTGRRSVDLDE